MTYELSSTVIELKIKTCFTPMFGNNVQLKAEVYIYLGWSHRLSTTPQISSLQTIVWQGG